MAVISGHRAWRRRAESVKLEDLHKPAIPVAYGQLILEVAADLGVARAAVLEGQGINAAVLDQPEARLSMLQANQLLYRALRLSGNPALGYEIGLHSSLTSHGFIGYGLMSHATLREGVDFGSKFLRLRLPNLGLRVFVDGAQGVIETVETIPLGAVRQCMLELFLVGLWQMARYFAPQDLSTEAIELWFDYPEPPHYRRYQQRLPRLRFEMPANQMRFPARFLDAPLKTANPVTAQLVTQQCEQELSRLGYGKDFLAQVRSLLGGREHGYLSLAQLAASLHISSRTLKRRLRDHGLSFQQLLDERRRRDALDLLADPTLGIAEIAARVGFSDPANFTRAFRKWLGTAPSAYRSGKG